MAVIRNIDKYVSNDRFGIKEHRFSCIHIKYESIMPALYDSIKENHAERARFIVNIC